MAKCRERVMYGMYNHRGVLNLEFSDDGEMIHYLELWLPHLDK